MQPPAPLFTYDDGSDLQLLYMRAVNRYDCISVVETISGAVGGFAL